jgi:DNA-3-methyladenine glycosylase II
MPDHDTMLAHFSQHDQVIFQLLKKYGAPELQSPYVTEQFFHRLCRAILGQQLSTKVAEVISNRFDALLPSLPPQPAHVLELTDEQLRGVGLSRAKVTYVRALATAVAENSVDLERISELGNEAVIEHLIQVKGVGRWTAEMFLMFTLGRPDVFSVGDLGLKTAIIKQYEISPEEYLAFVAEKQTVWQPYRTSVAKLLWQSLVP